MGPSDLFAMWVDALRSGNYLQCHGDYALIEEDGTIHLCALGVFMDVANRAGFGPFDPFDVTDSTLDGVSELIESRWPSSVIADVIDWNDILDLTFDQIATSLEELRELEIIK